MNAAFRVLLTINATSMLIIIYLIKSGVVFDTPGCLVRVIGEIPNWFFYILYCLPPIALTWLSILLSKWLPRCSFNRGDVVEIGYANNNFLPSYLGYFFVALSIPNVETLLFVYGILAAFTFLSQALYFNPLFLVFGYQFYNLKTKNGAEVFLISKCLYRSPGDVVINKAFSVNDYTLIEGRK
jgi:hypothetical protein